MVLLFNGLGPHCFLLFVKFSIEAAENEMKNIGLPSLITGKFKGFPNDSFGFSRWKGGTHAFPVETRSSRQKCDLSSLPYPDGKRSNAPFIQASNDVSYVDEFLGIIARRLIA